MRLSVIVKRRCQSSEGHWVSKIKLFLKGKDEHLSFFITGQSLTFENLYMLRVETTKIFQRMGVNHGKRGLEREKNVYSTVPMTVTEVWILVSCPMSKDT